MKKNLLKLMCLSLVAMLTFTACGGSKTQENKAEKEENAATSQAIEAIKQKGKLIVGTSADYPPYEFKALIDNKEEIVGFDIEIAKKIAEKLGVELEVKDMDFGVLLPTVKTGQVDMIIAGLNPNPEREKEIGLSNVYYESSQGVLVRKADLEVYTSADALKGKKLGAQMGSIQEEMANSIENAEVKSLPLTTSLLVDLKTEKIDAIIMEAPVAKQYANNDEELAVPDFVFESAEKGAAIGVKKENTDLLQFINETLDELKADGSIDKFVVDAINLSNEQAQ
ncbi:hypothetical protein HMPREF9630_00716 [Peptoanaerobacter stomatis]|uniref:ABC transporter, substrate-binding protein, family 3 n=1 Tax=Peptoanaerobacter stomatis TaxID=796937 RepID=J6HM81_9FIRM|nr:transporter substrate-binding domain-containing protein [Peptoanaerobacter stomatis]EHL15347.1 hypothetical protein HMPREF9630_00716 [Peptoanaerobacter stomatis]EJU23543.1 ABC transporter, substrate-binding protein, family 3 [Peptoanaerobacter stomatis]NWO24534.1 transporter substrate-binding domain-containing protein [Peptostreptococcaceae bacterium oral taxon 081]